jgi:hypothetical protein
MRYNAARFALAVFSMLPIAACSMRGAAPVPASPAGSSLSRTAIQPPVPNLSGTYKGTVIESSQGRSVKDPLKITIKQSGNKFTGIFDIVLKTISDEFPIEKGVVIVSQGKTILHFTIEGAPGRNAKATARLVGTTIKGRAKVPARNGPAVRFKYSAKKE